MADVIFVALILVLFGSTVLLVRVCERIVGGAQVTPVERSGAPEDLEAAA